MVAVFVAAAFMCAPPVLAADPLADQPYAIAYDNRMATPVMINGEGPFELLLDTGSSQTILFARAAQRLALKPIIGAHILIHSIADSVSSPPYSLSDLAFGNEHIAGLTIAVLPDPDDTGKGPDGVLGIDVLERYAIVLSHPDGRMKLYPRAGGTPEPYNKWRFTALTPMKLKDLPINLWFVDARYGDYQAQTLFDLGTGITIMTWDLARQLIRRPYMPSKTDDEVRDALGKGVPAFRIEDLSIQVARRVWRGEIALVADAPVFQYLDFGGRPAGIIGAGLLKDNSFAIDFQNQRLYVASRGE